MKKKYEYQQNEELDYSDDDFDQNEEYDYSKDFHNIEDYSLWNFNINFDDDCILLNMDEWKFEAKKRIDNLFSNISFSSISKSNNWRIDRLIKNEEFIDFLLFQKNNLSKINVDQVYQLPNINIQKKLNSKKNWILKNELISFVDSIKMSDSVSTNKLYYSIINELKEIIYLNRKSSYDVFFSIVKNFISEQAEQKYYKQREVAIIYMNIEIEEIYIVLERLKNYMNDNSLTHEKWKKINSTFRLNSRELTDQISSKFNAKDLKIIRNYYNFIKHSDYRTRENETKPFFDIELLNRISKFSDKNKVSIRKAIYSYFESIVN